MAMFIVVERIVLSAAGEPQGMRREEVVGGADP